jgi:hypothetical protein
MKDPDRLLRGEATPLERLLLDASAKERLAPELLAQTRIALGLPATAPPLGLRDVLSSWGPKVVLALAGAALVGTLVGRHSEPPTPVTASPVVAPVPPAPVKPATAAAPAEAPTLSVESLPLAPEPERAATPSNAATSDSLKEEIAQLDKVRKAISAGAPAQALTELNTYRTRFPRGLLRPESVVLKIQALKASGNTAQAASLAQSFLAKNPNSPHAERIKNLVGSTAGSP